MVGVCACVYTHTCTSKTFGLGVVCYMSMHCSAIWLSKIYLIYLFLATSGLLCCVRALSSCSARAFLVGGAWALGCQGFGSCGTWAYWPCGMSWNLPGPGIEPVFSALAWGFLLVFHFLLSVLMSPFDSNVSPLSNTDLYMPSSKHIGCPVIISKGDKWCFTQKSRPKFERNQRESFWPWKSVRVLTIEFWWYC